MAKQYYYVVYVPEGGKIRSYLNIDNSPRWWVWTRQEGTAFLSMRDLLQGVYGLPQGKSFFIRDGVTIAVVTEEQQVVVTEIVTLL